MNTKQILKGATQIGLALILSATVLGCSDYSNYERHSGKQKEDFTDLLHRQGDPAARKRVEPPIPELQPILAAPSAPVLAENRLITISVSDNVPLKDVLVELGRKADVEVEIDPRISGGIIFSARERPLNQVAERIADLAGLRHTFKNNVLRFEVDSMYHHNYRLEALNMIRKTKSSVSTNTDVFSAVSGGGSSAGGNASSSQVDGTSEIDFWTEMTTNIKQIMDNSDPRKQSYDAAQVSLYATAGNTAAAPQSAPTTPVATTPAAAPQATTPQTGVAAGSGTAATGGAASTATQGVQTAQAIAGATTSAVAQATGSGGTTGGTTGAAAGGTQQATLSAPTTTQSYYSFNKQAGVVSIYGNSKQHKNVKSYLDQVHRAITSQVLIEAKVIEVTLADQFSSGINWRTFLGGNLQLAAPFGVTAAVKGVDKATLPLTGPPFNAWNTATTDALTVGYLNNTAGFGALLEFIKEFGTVRTLSSPRLTVMNNQTAVLKVAENQAYFTLTVSSTTSSTGTTTTYSSTLHTVPIGLVMTVQPSINNDSEQITLGLRPTISRKTGTVSDPAVALQNVAGVTSTVPVVEVREMDSVITIPNGHVVVMGGLMQERNTKSELGLPGLMDLPLIGHAFKAQADEIKLTELVVLLKATMVNAEDSIAKADRDLYHKFMTDPRPVAF
jgi:MSHA biogenesis protein MshL